MDERNRRIVQAAVIVVVLGALVWLDLLAAERLTGGRVYLPMPIDSALSICPGQASPARDLISKILVEHAGVVANAACVQELHTPNDWLLKASPYPPFLGEYDPDSRPPDAGSAVVVTGGRVVQISIFSGSADTTPSRFVPSVRGDESYHDGHTPTYLFVHEAGESARPKLLFAAWASEEVGGLEGVREVAIALSLLVVEVALVGLLVAVHRWRRPR